MPRVKRPGLTGQALDRAVKRFPKEDRERMRVLLAPMPTASQIQRQEIAKLKKRTTREQRQAILDQIRAGLKFGEVASSLGFELMDVLRVHAMNSKRHVYYTLNEISV